MTFLSPSFLFAIGVILIPILIHLFNFKRFKKIYFSNVSFLKDIKQESEKKSKLKHLLVLLSRVLALSCLVFAFSQPIILKDEKNSKANLIGIYIDNSFSMNSKNENGQLFEQGKETAIKLVENYGQSYEYRLVTNDLLGKHTHVLSKDAMLEELKNITLSANSPSFNKIENRLIKEEAKSETFLISDFQKSTFKLNEIESLKSEHLFIPIQPKTISNLFIDSIWFSTPNRTQKANEKLFVKIKNQSDNKLNFKLTLNINDADVAFTDETILDNSESIIELNFNSLNYKNIRGKLNLSEYETPEVLFDDHFYFAYSINSSTSISIISSQQESNNDFNRLYSLDSTSQVSSMDANQLDYNILGESNLIILNQLQDISSGLKNQLIEYLGQGKSIVVIPNKDISIDNYNAFFNEINANQFSEIDNSKVKLSLIDKKHPFFESIFLSTNQQMDLPLFYSKYNSISYTNSQEKSIIKFQNGSNFLTETSFRSGKIYKIYSPLKSKEHNFYNHALFVPIMLRIKELSNKGIPTYFSIGDENKINSSLFFNQNNINEEENQYLISNSESQFIPQVSRANFSTYISFSDEIKKSGFQYLSLKNNPETFIPIAFNYNRNESNIESHSIDELTKLGYNVLDANNPIIAIEQHIKKMKGKSLWIYFIFAALLFFLIEILLIRFLK